MKCSQRATLLVLSLAVLSSVASIGLVAFQLRPQRAAVAVVIDTGIVAELNGVSDAVRDMPLGLRAGVLARHGVDSEKALHASLRNQRSGLARDERARRDELESSDKRLAILLALGAFNVCAAALATVSLYDAYSGTRRGAA